jgi:phosphopantothenoylcysteine synthetase/decarboxylase
MHDLTYEGRITPKTMMMYRMVTQMYLQILQGETVHILKKSRNEFVEYIVCYHVFLCYI